MNAKSSTLRPSSGRQSMLNIIGVTVLVLGLGIASVVLLAGRSKVTADTDVSGDWHDDSLAVEDSKASTRDVEMYNGKLGMLGLKLSDAFHQPQSLALIIAATSSLIAVGCFYVSRRLYSDNTPENGDVFP